MFQRTFLAKASEVELDSQGRILIPSGLISEAGLVKECLIIGVANHLEIWSKDKWNSLEQEQLDSFETYAENLSGFME